MKIRNTPTAAIAAAGLCVAGLGAFAAGSASAATTSARHQIKHPIKAVAVCSGKGQLGWTSGGQRYQCKKPSGWHRYRWVRDPVTPPAPPAPSTPPVPPVLGLTPWQQIQTWAAASGNAEWTQVFGVDTALLAAEEALTPDILAGPAPTARFIDYTPSGGVQAAITTDAQALVTAAQAALAIPAPANFTASWDAVMTDQVAYGNQIAANAADWGAYTFSQPDATAAEGMAVSDELTAIQAVPIVVPSVTAIVPLTPDLTLDNQVITWLGTTPGALANQRFTSLSNTMIIVATGLNTFNGGTISGSATLALAALPPGNLAAPFAAVANAYLTIGQSISSTGTVTQTMDNTLNAAINTWITVVQGDGTDVPTWFTSFP
jgi:hypothetical protein